MDDSTTTSLRGAWRRLTRTVRWIVVAGMLAVPAAIMAWRGWAVRWISDDGFINLRIVRHLLGGHGPVYNVAERVEAYTSTIWIAILGAIGATGVRLEHAAVGAGIGLTVGGFVLAQWAATRWHGAGDESLSQTLVCRWSVPLGVGMYVALPVAWDYATSGLETGLALAWLGGSGVAVLSAIEDGFTDEALNWRWWTACVVVGVGPLVRPGLTLFSMAWAVPLTLAWWRAVGHRVTWRRWAVDVGRSLGVGLALPIVYQIFRLGYFASPVPNTALAKTAFGSQWQQGWHYAEHFFGLFYFAVPLGLAAVLVATAAARHAHANRPAHAAWGLAPLVTGAVYCLYIIRIGGGFMYGRLFLPAVFGMLMPLAVFPLRSSAPTGESAEAPGQTASREAEAELDGEGDSGTASSASIYPGTVVLVGRVGFVLVLLGWMVVCGFTLRVPTDNYKGIGDERGWYADQADDPTPVRIEEYEPHSFHADARGLKKRAERVCSDGDDRKDSDDGLQRACDRGIVYPDKPQTTAFGRFFPGQSTYPLQRRFVDHGVRLTAMRTAIGIRGYVVGEAVHLVDHVGLADPFAARLDEAHRSRPGHRKALSNPWMVARFAERQPVEDYRITAAREALGCGALADLHRAVTGSLTVGQFMQNLIDAWRFWGLRLPKDPLEARRAFCGRAAPKQVIKGGEGGNEHRWRCPVGYHLDGLRIGEATDARALAFLEPRCRASSPDAVPEDMEMVTGPRIGGSASGGIEMLSCEQGRLVGFRGKAASFVHRLAPICKTDSGSTDVDPTTGSNDGADIGFDKGESVELRCADDARPVGFAGRTGQLVDAAGILCPPER